MEKMIKQKENPYSGTNFRKSAREQRHREYKALGEDLIKNGFPPKEKWERMSYSERLHMNNAYASASPSLGRMVADGRGGEFFAVWGTDDN